MAFEVFYKDFYYDYLTDTLSWQDKGNNKTLRGFSVAITEMEAKRLNNALNNCDEEFMITKNDIKGLYKRMRQAFTIPFERILLNQTVQFVPIVKPFIGYIVSETGLIMRIPLIEHVKNGSREYYRAIKWKVLEAHDDSNRKLTVTLPDPRNNMNRNHIQVAKIVYESFNGKTPKFTRFEYIDGNNLNTAISNLRIKEPKIKRQYRETNKLFNK